MHLLMLFFLIVGCLSDFKVIVDEKGRFNISIDGHVWLRSGPTALYVDNQWYTSDNDSLPLNNLSYAEGIDSNLGSWNETQLNYALIRNGTHTNVVSRIRQWASVSGITFHLDIGNQTMTNTNPLTTDNVRTVFPSFNVEQIDNNDKRGYFTFEGIMTGDGGKHAGMWNSASHVVRSGMESGPVVVFNTTQQGEDDMLVISSFSRFMSTSLSQENNLLKYGVMGSILSIPANYNHSLIVFYSSKGINEGIREWGQIMQKAYNRTNQYRLNDISINYLGYYTDNGAYYYYHTEVGQNYEQTLLNVIYNLSLPFHYLQLDSWWYYKGIGDGVRQWTARPDIFPNGLPSFDRQLENMPIVAHNRYWAYDTIYKQNYSFILDESNGIALPSGNDSFWSDLFTQAREWGLIVYEQDWLIAQTEQFTPIHNDIHLGHQWLTSMGEAADKLGINLQYCMSLPRHILTALQIPRVTQTRTSTDYYFHLIGQAEQWAIGISNMFADAIGLAPFKDVFWSNTYESNAPYTNTSHESLPDREIFISTLSGGPVASGDSINYTNIQRIMKCCRQDGLILKPDRPLTTINRLVSDWAVDDGVSQGEVYSTRTTISNQTFYIIFASAMTHDYTIYPSMIGASSGGVIWSSNNARKVANFSDTDPLQIAARDCHNTSFCVWYVSPFVEFSVSNNTHYVLLGETNKWVPVSPQRFVSIDNDIRNGQVIIRLQGASGESVGINLYHSNLQFVTAHCEMSRDNGIGYLVITRTQVICT